MDRKNIAALQNTSSPPQTETPKRIIVLGIMRSGTSLVADLVRLWGAYAGPQDKIWKSDANDARGYGYMEYIPLQRLNNELLDDNDRLPPHLGRLEEKASEPNYREKARSLIQNMERETVESGQTAWVWKDARLPLTLPFWELFWGDVIYVITVRHPAEVILSLAKAAEVDQDDLPYSAGLTYWQYCMFNVLAYTQNNPRKIFISYDQLINHPEQETVRLCSFLDSRCGSLAKDAGERMDAMQSRVSGSERHHHYKKSMAEMTQATREQRALYNFLRVKTLYPDEPYNQDDFALYPGWREYLESVDALMALQGIRNM
jgi:hypothetical protein